MKGCSKKQKGNGLRELSKTESAPEKLKEKVSTDKEAVAQQTAAGEEPSAEPNAERTPWVGEDMEGTQQKLPGDELFCCGEKSSTGEPWATLEQGLNWLQGPPV